MEINRVSLREALVKCLPGVDLGRTLLEGADTFIFKGGKIFTYNDNISVSVPFECGIEGAVKAKEFYSLINKLKNDTIEFKEKEGAWKIIAGNVEVDFTLVTSPFVENIDEMGLDEIKWKKLPVDFMTGVRACQIAGNTSTLSGIYVKDSVIASSDEVRINWFSLGEKMDTFWLTDIAASELCKLGDVNSYSVGAAWVHFKTIDGVIFSAKRLNDANFPFAKLQEAVKMHERVDEKVYSLPQAVIDAIDRASVMSIDVDIYSVVRLTIDAKHIEVYSERAAGKYRERVPFEESYDTDLVVLYVDTAMVEFGLKNFAKFYIKNLQQNWRSVVFQGENVLHIISTLQVEGE